MASRRVTRSTANVQRETGESEAQFWSSIPDPSQIEREQAEALRVARLATIAPNQTGLGEMDTQPQSYLTNYTKNSTTAASQVLQTMFVSDDKMQVMGSLTHSRSERVVTPVDMEQPLDPRYVQPTPRRDDDLDVQPSRGPREAVNVMGDIIDNYFEENLIDVLKVSGLGSNFSAYLQPTRDSNTTTHPSEQPDIALEWYVPDGTNRQLVNILDKSVANFKSPGGGMGAMLVLLPQLHPFYGMDQFLVDLDTGELFVLVKAQWRHSGLYCMNNPFELEKLWKSIEHNSAIMKSDMETEEQTPVVRIWQETKKRSSITGTTTNGESRNLRQIPRCNATPCKKKLCKGQNAVSINVYIGVWTNRSNAERGHL